MLEMIERQVRGTHSSPREDRVEARFRQDALHLFPFVSLDFDAAIFHRASYSAGFLHYLREFLFFRETDPGEVLRDRDRFAAAMRGLTEDVHATTIGVFLTPFGGLHGNDGSGILRALRQLAESVQGPKGMVPLWSFLTTRAIAFLLPTHPLHSTMDPAKLTLIPRFLL